MNSSNVVRKDQAQNVIIPKTKTRNAYVVSGIEWAFDRGFKFHYGIKERQFVEEYIRRSQILPIAPSYQHAIRFWDKVWDFAPLFPGTSPVHKRINFQGIPDCYQTDCRLFLLLHLLHSDSKISTIVSLFKDVRSFYKYLHSQKIYSIEDVTTDHIQRYAASKKQLGSSSKAKIWIALIKLYEFYVSNYSFTLDISVEYLEQQKLLSIKRKKDAEQARKTANIPTPFYVKFVEMLRKVLADEQESYNNRAVSAYFLILSQTGLRASEISTLKCDCLVKEESLLGYADPFCFLKTKIYKTAGKNSNPIEHKTFVTKDVLQAVETLLAIRPAQNYKDSDFLFTPTTIKRLPMSSYLPRQIMAKYLYDNRLSFADPDCVTWEDIPLIQISRDGKNHSVYLPTATQFRVHVITDLLNKKVELSWVQEFMGHLSEEMTSYYYRATMNKPKESEVIKKLYDELRTEQVQLINQTNNSVSKQIASTPPEKQQFKIVQDKFGVILQDGNLTITAKHGGFCIKPGKARCSDDPYGHEDMCAFGRCSNMHYCYFFSNVIYQDFLNIKTAVEMNYNAGMWLQAEHELNNLKDLCQRALEPTLQQLKAKIAEKGPKELVKRHPNLGEIVQNFSSIIKEVQEWKSKTI